MDVYRRFVVLACLVVAGCGGDDGDGRGGGQANSTDWVQEANGICQEAREKAASLPKNLGQDQDSPAHRKDRAIVEEKLTRLRAVEPPDDAAGDFDHMVDLNEMAFALSDDFLAAVRRAVNAEPGTKGPLLARSVEIGDKRQRLSKEAAEIARDLGLTTCAGA